MIKFEYNGRQYAPANFEKKLKALGITKEQVKIIEDTSLTKPKPEGLREYPFQYRVNANTVLQAYTQEDLDKLKSWWNIQ